MTDETGTTGTEIATLGGGCFWCVEAVFQELEGVIHVESGYAGGETLDPTYQEICAGTTGHAEVVQVHFDPAIVSFREVLEVFFATHDPTTLNQQGGDIGTQYRSVIFYDSPRQREVAEESIIALEAEQLFTFPIVTEVSPLEKFHPAEGYHQDYFRQNPVQGYCQAVINPKMAKFRAAFAHKLKSK